MKFLKLSVATVLFFVISAPLWAGVLMTSLQQNVGSSTEKTTMTASIEKTGVRVDVKGKDTDQTTIFRQDKGLFWIIDNKEKTYMEMTKTDVERLQAKMEEATKQMEEAMKDMPADQRAMMEQMMKGKMPASAPKTTYSKVASGQKIGRWTCDQYEGQRDGVKESEVWTTDWKTLDLTAEDFKALEEMGKFFSGLTKSSASFFKVNPKAEEGLYSGVPVRMIHYRKGKPEDTVEIQDVKRQDFSAATFDLPSDLKKQKMEQPED